MIARRIAWLAVSCLTWAAAPARGDDWTQYQGPRRDGTWTERGIVTSFPEGGPPVLWRAEIGGGFAGPAVAGDRVLVTDYRLREGDPTPNPGRKNELQGTERVLCFDRRSGKQLWVHTYDCPYKISYPAGPRATPTLDGDRVYTLGAEGHLHCLALEDGGVLWAKSLKEAYGLPLAPHWGFTSHPLVHGDLLYCVVGGEGSVAIALDKQTGEERWRALSASEPGYCPPTLIRAGGTEQLLIWHAEALNSLDPATGELYWSFELKTAYGMSIVPPMQHGDYLYATALQGTSLLLELDRQRPAAREVWRGHGPHPDHNPPLIVDGHIYGADEKGHLRCFELQTGERLWETLDTAPNGRPASASTAFLVKNGDQYFIFNEGGELILASLSPAGYQERGRCQVLEPTCTTGNRKVVWSPPAFAHGCFFARNDRELVCLSLAETPQRP